MNAESFSINNTITPTYSLQNITLPIFFFHQGNETGLFFDKILQQAKSSNGKQNIFVLADANFHLFSDYNCIDINQYRYGTVQFDKVYKHHSSNNYFFEKACFDRWFIINAVVKDLEIEYFFHADSDVLILENLYQVYESFLKNKYDGTVMYLEDEHGDSVTSGHASFWSAKMIDDFCNFVCTKYQDEQAFNILLKNTLAGKYLNNTNVSDMILLDLFRTEANPNALNLLSLGKNDIFFDFNLNSANNGSGHRFVMSKISKIKKITKRKGACFGKATEPSSLRFKFYTLHFQGYLIKSLIPKYVKSTGVYEALNNYLNAEYIFLSRKLRLLKNTSRDWVFRLIGKK